METWVFTFGCGQLHEGCYVEIEADSFFEARRIMFEHFDNKWASQYDSAEAAGVSRFGLTQIDLFE